MTFWTVLCQHFKCLILELTAANLMYLNYYLYPLITLNLAAKILIGYYLFKNLNWNIAARSQLC